MFRPNKISYKNLKDELLMQLICKGNRQGFETLYDRYFDKLIWFAQGYLNNKPKAEDTIQDVFIKIIEKPEMFDTSRKFSTWIYTITANTCKNVLRNELNRNKILDENRIEIVGNLAVQQLNVDKSILKQCIHKAYNELSDKEKNIFVLRFEEELSIKEISEIMDIPEGSVKSGIYYLLKKMTIHVKDFKHGT